METGWQVSSVIFVLKRQKIQLSPAVAICSVGVASTNGNTKISNVNKTLKHKFPDTYKVKFHKYLHANIQVSAE